MQKTSHHIQHEVDRNTSYFHSKANYRRKRNYIDALQENLGLWYYDRHIISHLLNKHFTSEATSTNSIMDNDLLNHITPCITDQENELLLQVYIADEIKQVFFSY